MFPVSQSLRATLTGVGLASLSTSLGGVTVVLTRFVIAETDALTLAFVRYGIAALFLAVILISTTRIPRIARRDLIVISVLGIIMFTGFPFFMARALEEALSEQIGPVCKQREAGILRPQAGAIQRARLIDSL